MYSLTLPCLQLKPLQWPVSQCSFVLLQRSRRNLQVHARDLNAVERGIRGYQYNASGAVKKGRALQLFCPCHTQVLNDLYSVSSTDLLLLQLLRASLQIMVLGVAMEQCMEFLQPPHLLLLQH